MTRYIPIWGAKILFFDYEDRLLLGDVIIEKWNGQCKFDFTRFHMPEPDLVAIVPDEIDKPLDYIDKAGLRILPLIYSRPFFTNMIIKEDGGYSWHSSFPVKFPDDSNYDPGMIHDVLLQDYLNIAVSFYHNNPLFETILGLWDYVKHRSYANDASLIILMTVIEVVCNNFCDKNHYNTSELAEDIEKLSEKTYDLFKKQAPEFASDKRQRVKLLENDLKGRSFKDLSNELARKSGLNPCNVLSRAFKVRSGFVHNGKIDLDELPFLYPDVELATQIILLSSLVNFDKDFVGYLSPFSYEWQTVHRDIRIEEEKQKSQKEGSKDYNEASKKIDALKKSIEGGIFAINDCDHSG